MQRRLANEAGTQKPENLVFTSLNKFAMKELRRKHNKERVIKRHVRITTMIWKTCFPTTTCAVMSLVGSNLEQ